MTIEKFYELLDSGILDAKTVLEELLARMGEHEVRNFLKSSPLFSEFKNENEDEDEEKEIDIDDDLYYYLQNGKSFTLYYDNDDYDCFNVIKVIRNEDGNFNGIIETDDRYHTRFEFNSIEDLIEQLKDYYGDFEIGDC